MGLLKDELRKFINDRNRRNAMIQKIAIKLCNGDMNEAKELFQEVIFRRFLKRSQKKREFAMKNINTSFDGYLFNSVRNYFIDEQRKKNAKKRKDLKDHLKRQRQQDELLYDEPMKNNRDDKIDIFSSKEMLDIINKCIPDETNRMIFTDKVINKMRYQQMIEKYEKMGIVSKKENKPFTTRESLRQRVFRVKKDLKKCLSNKKGENGK